MGIEGPPRDPEFWPIAFGVTGFTFAIAWNTVQGRPWYASLYVHAGLSGLGYMGGRWWEKRQYRSLKQRLLVLQDYMEKHPDDFVVERKQFKDVFRPWTPVR